MLAVAAQLAHFAAQSQLAGRQALTVSLLKGTRPTLSPVPDKAIRNLSDR